MFQVFTAMAFLLFAEEKVDIAVIEVNYLFRYFQQLLYTNMISGNSYNYLLNYVIFFFK